MIKYLSKKLVKVVAVVALAGSANNVDAQAPIWSQAGPVYSAGRSRNMIVDKNDQSGNTLYVGSSSSGVFISTNGGAKWTALPLFNNQLNVSYMAQAADGKIYVATGEGFLRPGQKLKAQPGTGLYKIDGSIGNQSLTLVASSATVGTVINRVACSPSNANAIALATNKGILTSTDGGITFSPPSGIPTATSISGQDLKFNSSGILYCSAGNENAFNISDQNEFSKVYKSMDNSLSTFTVLSNLNSSLLQDDHYGRIELAIAPSNNSVIYASCATKYSGPGVPASSNLKGLFVSYDGGDHWGLILQGSSQLDPLSNGETCLSVTLPNGGSISSGDYAQVVTVHPTNPDELYIGSYQFYTWVKTVGTNTANPVGTWTKHGCTFITNTGLSLPPNIHDIKLIASGSSISRYYFVTDAGIYRSVDALTSFQPFYKGLVTGQFNSVSIERFPLANVPAPNTPTAPTHPTNVTPYIGFIGGTGGNGLNYFSALNDTLVTKEVVYTGGDVYESEFSKILPNAAYFTQGSGKLFRTTDVRTSDPTEVDLVASARTQSIFPFDNTTYNVTGTPFKIWENYGQTPLDPADPTGHTRISPDSVVFYNDSLRFAASIIGVATLTAQTSFSFSAARPNASALIDSIVVRTGTVTLPIATTTSASPAFSGSDRKDINIKLPNNYTISPTGKTTIVNPPGQMGPVITTSTSIFLNDSSLLDNIKVTFNAPPFVNKTAPSYPSVPDAAAYYRVFATVFYKYNAGSSVSVVDDRISTKTFTYTTVLTNSLSWTYGNTLPAYTITATNTVGVTNPTFVVTPGAITNTPSSNPTFTVRPISTTNYTMSAYGQYTATAKPVTYSISAVPAGTASIPNPTYVLTPGNFTQTTTVFTVTPATTTNYTITETGTSTNTAFTYSTVNSSTYVLNPGNVTQSTPVFTIVVTPTMGLTTYTLQGLSSNTLIGANTSTNITLPLRTFTNNLGYFLASIPPTNKPVKIPIPVSARLAVGYGANVYISNAPLSLNNPLSLINVSSNKCLTTDAAGNKLSGPTNTVAISGTVTALEWSKSGTELYYATNDPLPAGSGNTFLYRVSYIDALLDSTAKNYSGKLHTNVFTFSNTVAPDGSKNNPRSPYRTTILGTYTNIVTGISVTNDNKAIAVTFETPAAKKILYSTVADVRKCDSTNVLLVDKTSTGILASHVYCSLMEMSNNKKVFLGTDKGVFYTDDITAAAPTWNPGNNGLPTLQIFDLEQQVMNPWECYNSGLIYAATNGRGVFVDRQYLSSYYVGVQEIAAAAKGENNLSLYPNPTNGNVTVLFNGVSGESAIINIMDLNGRVVRQESLGKLDVGQINYSFETSELASGMYIVNISSNSGIKRVAKLVVTK